jgi:RNA polymerase sigma-70 factor, ECF subfamily
MHIFQDDRFCGRSNRLKSCLVALDEALQGLAQIDPRKARVVELRFFGGLSVEETAEVLNVSGVTVMRDWSTARAWLYREIAGGGRDGS